VGETEGLGQEERLIAAPIWKRTVAPIGWVTR
jgi:hypothetical protein